ncbi:MAG: glycosyltransferase family 2 [Treponematales bacterium]
MPAISIIVPVYNVEPYLRRCLDSVLAQTFTDWECVIVDDGSPDGCPAICDEYAARDSRIRVIHKQNAGLGFARNSGLEIAAGEFVAFVDSDDFVDAAMYEALYRTAREYRLDTVYCGLFFFRDEHHKTPRKEVDEFTIFRGRQEVDAFLLDYIGPEPSFPVNHKYMKAVWRALYSRELIKNNHLEFYSEKEIASEDILFSIDYLTKASAVGFLPEHFYYYCYNNSSISKSISRNMIEKIKMLLKAVDKKLERYFSPDEYKIHYYRLILAYFTYILKIESRLNQKHKNRAILDCRNDALFSDLFNTYPFYKLPIKSKLFYWCAKYRFVWPLRIVLMFLEM